MSLTFNEVIESKRKHNQYENALKKELDLNIGEVSILSILSQRDGKVDVATLQNELGIASSTIGSIIRNLKKKGYIVKQRQEDNERFIEIFIKEDKASEVDELITNAELLIEDAFSDKPADTDETPEDAESDTDTSEDDTSDEAVSSDNYTNQTSGY